MNEVDIWSVVNHRIQNRLRCTHKIASLRDKIICFALETPEERNLDLDEYDSPIRMIEVFHFHQTIDRAHGMPFRCALI